MKALKSITIGTVSLLVTYFVAKFVWLLFWDVLLKIFGILQTAFMIGIVAMAVYVLWKILGARTDSIRD